MRNLVYAIHMQLLKIQSDYNHSFSLTRKKGEVIQTAWNYFLFISVCLHAGLVWWLLRLPELNNWPTFNRANTQDHGRRPALLHPLSYQL